MTFNLLRLLKISTIFTGLHLPACYALAETKATQMQLQFGAIADCQYADKSPAGARLYRTCPTKLTQAIAVFNQQPLSFVVHLGDFIDEGWASLQPLLEITGNSTAPFKFVLGNHDFAVADPQKQTVPAALGMPARYYSEAYGEWLFIFLDGNDLSSYAWAEGSDEWAESLRVHEQKYPQAPLWSGGIGQKQIKWLRNLLADADTQQQKVVLFCHFPLFPENEHNLWNADEILALLDQHPSVVVWFSGHNHDGNYGARNGVYFVNLKGMLDTENTAYSLITLSENAIKIDGVGREHSRVLPLNSQPK